MCGTPSIGRRMQKDDDLVGRDMNWVGFPVEMPEFMNSRKAFKHLTFFHPDSLRTWLAWKRKEWDCPERIV